MLGVRRAGLTALAIVVGAGLVASGCQTDRQVTEPDPVPVTEKRLADALLTEDDLPAGWTVAAEGTPINTEVIPEHACDDAISELEPKEAASADFSNGPSVLTSSVAWFPGAGGNVEELVRDVAEDCEAVVVAAEGLSLLTSPLDFGVLSDDTLALQIEAEAADGSIEERDVILLREGDLVSVVRLTGPRPSNKELLDSVVRTSIGRVGQLSDDTT